MDRFNLTWNFYLCFISIIFLSACNQNNLKGRIDYRIDNITCVNDDLNFETLDSRTIAAYLINISKDEMYEFTINVKRIINDSVISYYTEKKILSPGEETRLGCKDYKVGDPFFKKIILDTFIDVDNSVKYFYISPNGTRIDENKIREKYGNRADSTFFHKFFHKSEIEIYDSSRPKIQDNLKFEYKCTGQLLIKNDRKVKN